MAVSCWWRSVVGGGQLLVAVSCWWRSVVGGGQLLVAVSCWWRSVVGGGQLLVAVSLETEWMFFAVDDHCVVAVDETAA